MEEKSVLINREVHSKLKDYSRRSGVKIKALVEAAILAYLRKIKIMEE